MRIIIDIHPFPGTYLSASGNFLQEMVLALAREYSDHSFIFLAHKSLRKIGDLPYNFSIYYTNMNASKWLGKQLWYKYILPKVLKKLKSDLFVTADNRYLKKYDIPSCLFLMHAGELLEQDSPLKNDGTRKKFVYAIQQATKVITFSVKDRTLLQAQPNMPASKVKFIFPRERDIYELRWTDKEMSKVDFAAGVEYFAFAGDLHERYNLLGLLKAFALFKKWQQSNMQLVIAGSKTPWTAEFTEKLSSFRYRKDVNLLINPSKEKIQKIIGGAYAFVYPATYDHFPINILHSMQAAIPVISTSFPVCQEWCGDAILYPDTNDPADLAKSMQLLYKDERYRSELITGATNRLATIQSEGITQACMNFFEESVAN
jgi:glycosyltransferase involved in cell wall biosynthesis